jgi:hypothetical protein
MLYYNKILTDTDNDQKNYHRLLLSSTCQCLWSLALFTEPGMKHDVAWCDPMLLARKCYECVSVINCERHYGQPVVLGVDVSIST